MFFPDALDTVSSEHDDVLAAEALSESLQAPSRPNVSLYNPGERFEREKREEVAGKVASAFAVLGIWTGEDERFAYVSTRRRD
jgi:protein AFG1